MDEINVCSYRRNMLHFFTSVDTFTAAITRRLVWLNDLIPNCAKPFQLTLIEVTRIGMFLFLWPL